MEKDWPNHSRVCRRRHARAQSKSEPHEVGTPAKHVVKPRAASTNTLVEEKKTEPTKLKSFRPTDEESNRKPTPLPPTPPLDLNRFVPGTNYAIDALFLPAKLEVPRVVQVECQDVVDMHGLSVHIEEKDFKRYIGEPPYSCRVLDNRGDVSFIFIFPRVKPALAGGLPVNRSIESLIDPAVRNRQSQKWRVGNTLVIVKPTLEMNGVVYRFGKDTEEKIRRSINSKLDDWFD
ncbi:hypothetical protein SCHPADRAFT_907772 [Schizopora paradoxa]|uniref:Uncharacterized protein n=1 Tax=Schizopora paradoxa TaxID=27342 RepID=A0A0H2RCC7_9AGAM|nr:hypothetical protein SCHPADRAFT_907772 [Schizopora paradoxa]